MDKVETKKSIIDEKFNIFDRDDDKDEDYSHV